MSRNLISIAAFCAAALCASAASATSVDYRYADAGTANPFTYSFSATADGPLTIYTMNSTGNYLSTLGVKVNGTTVADGILPSGSPIFVGTDLGTVHAGDSIEFFIDTYDAGNHLGTYYSSVPDNADGLQHVFADAYPGEPWIGVPAGVFFGFEDTTTGDSRSDFNYNDYAFVVSNLTIGAATVSRPGGGGDSSSAAVPEPASWAMMVGGFGLLGGAMRRRRRAAGVLA